MKIIQYFLLLILFSGLYSCKDKDFDVFGDICNYRTDTISLVISPYVSFDNYRNGSLHLKSYNSSGDTATYLLYPNTCSNLVQGTNQIIESDLRFSYLKIRSKTDTIIGNGQTAILSLFKESRKGLRRIEVY